MVIVPAVWKEKRLIESFDVDIQGRLRPQTLFAFLLNAAWNHASGGIYGYEELSTHNLLWVLIKVQMLIKRLPKWREQIIIETWGKRKVRLYALRDFTMTSETGETLISATSSWMILDRTSGRPQRFDQKSDSLPWLPGKDELETNLEKVQQLNGGKELARFRVHFSDIDVNRHVNSTKYLEWIIDSHSQEHLEAKEIRSLEMSFLSEAIANDEVTVYSEESGGLELCSVRRTVDDKEICRARLQWQTAV
jgi:medium-chain acyl-[acyl-carrier-protein] hydrolase